MQTDQKGSQNQTQYDLFSRQFKSNPFPTYALMRKESPFYAHNAPNGSTIWFITRYEDVVTVLKDDDHFCKNPQNARPQKTMHRQSNAMQQLINENMLFSDPPDHTRLRALVNLAFTPRRVEEMAPRVQTICNQLLADVKANGKMDLIANYALPLPVIVICEMLGIPAKDQVMVSSWSQAIISPGSRNLTYRRRKQQLRSFIAYLQAMFAQRRLEPEDDLVTALVQAEEAGDKLSEAELSSMVALLLVTGHETTVNLIGNGALALLENPDQLKLLHRQPGLWATAVAELLRYDGPVETSTSRWVRRDITLSGYKLKRGDLVRVVLASANRDANQFKCPNMLQIERTDNRHLAFGLGIHYCLGAPLAKLEGQIALQTLFQRLPDLRLGQPFASLTWRTGVLFRGMQELPVIWDT